MKLSKINPISNRSSDRKIISNWKEIFYEEHPKGERIIIVWDGEYLNYYNTEFKQIFKSECLSKITFGLKSALINSPILGKWFFDGRLQSSKGNIKDLIYSGINLIPSGVTFKYYITDFDEYETLLEGTGILDYTLRRHTIKTLLKKLPKDNNSVFLCDSKKVISTEEIKINIEGVDIVCKSPSEYKCIDPNFSVLYS